MVQSSVAGGACKESGNSLSVRHKTSSIRVPTPLPQTDSWTQPISATYFRMSNLKKSKLPLRNGSAPSSLQMAGKPQKFVDSRIKLNSQMISESNYPKPVTAESGKITQHILQEHNQSYDPLRKGNRINVSRQTQNLPYDMAAHVRGDDDQFQASAAASFFARAAQKLDLVSTKRRRRHQCGNSDEDQDYPQFLTNFNEILRYSPPPAPPALLRSVGRKDVCGLGKVKVMLRVSPLASQSDCNSSFLQIDSRKKQVTAYDPSACGFTTPEDRRVGVAAPKMFAFDAIFSQDDSQTEICSSSLTEVIQAVVNGTDSCLFSYGASNLGKTYTMIGKSDSIQSMGAIPCAISWLFKLINEEKQKTGARFSVRVSAVEIFGKNEELRDLLTEYANDNNGTSPAIYLKDDSAYGAQLQNQTELRAPTVEKAAYYLDAAISARSTEVDEEGSSSHFLFTLHVYQHRIDKTDKVSGGRSRLHFLDLGSCDKQGKNGSSLSLSAITNVILAIFNGQKHIPFRNCILTRILCEILGSLTCRAAMIAHVSPSLPNYNESLTTIQFASRIHRLRRKKMKHSAFITNDMDDSSMQKWEGNGLKSGSSDPDYTSSSEQSCDTVIYVGPNGLPLNDKELTDNEGPPIQITKMSGNAQNVQIPTTAVKKSDCRENNQSVDKIGLKIVPQVTKSLVECRIPVLSKMSSSWSTDKFVPESANRYPARQRSSSQAGFQRVNTSRSLTSAGSEECWVDGPRFSKSRLEVRATLNPRNETWVDGPQAVYGYMDIYKRKMIQRWVELQARNVPDIDQCLEIADADRAICTVPSETECTLSNDEVGEKEICSPLQIEENEEICSSESCLRLASNSNRVVLELETRITRSISFSNSLNKQGRSKSNSPERRSQSSFEQPVIMQDSCLQVTEEDILAACMDMIEEHPLRILSEENLASSFTDSLSLGENLSVCESEDCEEAMAIALENLNRLSVPSNLPNVYTGIIGDVDVCKDETYAIFDITNGGEKVRYENDESFISLRLPDGASNPNLCEESLKITTDSLVTPSDHRSPGNGAFEDCCNWPVTSDEVTAQDINETETSQRQISRGQSKIPVLVKPQSGVKQTIINKRSNVKSKVPCSNSHHDLKDVSNCIARQENLISSRYHVPQQESNSINITRKLDIKSDANFQASGTSSGYESMVRDSEGSGSSFSNPELTSDTSEDEEQKKSRQLMTENALENDVLQLKDYDQEDVERIERRRLMEERHELRNYHQKILRLRVKQNELRRELASAKERLMLSPQRWSYDLHVEECVNDADPCFLEVLERETEILEKRVMACKSRIMIVTCFDSNVDIPQDI